MTSKNNHLLLKALHLQWPDIPTDSWKIRPLTGLTQASYYITDGIRQMVGRAQTPFSKTLGVNRHRENKILRNLSITGISPKVIAMCGSWLFLEWLQGTKIASEIFSSPALQYSLAQSIALLHNQPRLGYPLQLKQQIAFQWQQIDRRRLSPGWLRLHKYFMATKLPEALKIAPAHMDIHPDNVLMTEEGLKLIDWEYAADVDIGFSLAVLFMGNQWNEIQQQTFLDYYCLQASGYSDIKQLKLHIEQWKPWVNYMALMWYEARWQQTKEPQFLSLAHPLRHAFKLT
ncbi:phosphotransferase [Xenorhabdus szentirmaii]|uniref:phosphotransferase n=1 Tax=Xenorhabdus szentirmaii TaxID=290112 RepID=UPI0019C6D41A|nr:MULTISPECIES: phosphotransferase [unclassified Xenorhabdus]MBD2791062.1 phosphotransferase [Xenorhabdus sp. CUL]MBD2825310.1 phosphotransferase [Xenorhabdus sp. 5]